MILCKQVEKRQSSFVSITNISWFKKKKKKKKDWKINHCGVTTTNAKLTYVFSCGINRYEQPPGMNNLQVWRDLIWSEVGSRAVGGDEKNLEGLAETVRLCGALKTLPTIFSASKVCPHSLWRLGLEDTPHEHLPIPGSEQSDATWHSISNHTIGQIKQPVEPWVLAEGDKVSFLRK